MVIRHNTVSLNPYRGLMGALNNGALTVSITLNHLYPMMVAKTRIFALHPVRGTSYTAVVGHLETHVLLGNCKAIIERSFIIEYAKDKCLA